MSYANNEYRNSDHYEERLCKFCNSTIKNPKCRIFGHTDGCMVKLSRFAIQRENDRQNSFHYNKSRFGNENNHSNTYHQPNFKQTSTVSSENQGRVRSYSFDFGSAGSLIGHPEQEVKSGNTYTGYTGESIVVLEDKNVSKEMTEFNVFQEPTPALPPPPKVYYDISKPRDKTKDAVIKPVDTVKRGREISDEVDIAGKKQQLPPLLTQHPLFPFKPPSPTEQKQPSPPLFPPPPTAAPSGGYQPYLSPPPSNPLPLEPLELPSTRINLSSLVSATSSSKPSSLQHSTSVPALTSLNIDIPVPTAATIGTADIEASSKNSTPTTSPRASAWAASVNRLKALQESNSIAKPTPTAVPTMQSTIEVNEEVSSRWMLAADENTQKAKYLQHKREKEKQSSICGPPQPQYVESTVISTSSKLQGVKGIIKKDFSQKTFEVVPVGRNKKILVGGGGEGSGSSSSTGTGGGGAATEAATVRKVFTIPLELIRSLVEARNRRKIHWRDMDASNTSLYEYHVYEQVDVVIDDSREDSVEEEEKEEWRMAQQTGGRFDLR